MHLASGVVRRSRQSLLTLQTWLKVVTFVDIALITERRSFNVPELRTEVAPFARLPPKVVWKDLMAHSIRAGSSCETSYFDFLQHFCLRHAWHSLRSQSPWRKCNFWRCRMRYLCYCDKFSFSFSCSSTISLLLIRKTLKSFSLSRYSSVRRKF